MPVVAKLALNVANTQLRSLSWHFHRLGLFVVTLQVTRWQKSQECRIAVLCSGLWLENTGFHY